MSTNTLTIGFVENRDRTHLWDAVGHRLILAGHQLNWLVQNHAFAPESGNTTMIPYPQNADYLPIGKIPDLAWLALSDRGALHFQAGTDHYGYYSDQIHSWLLKFKPDIVFGECTLFHELLCIYHCGKLGIPYVEPSGTRYPPGQLTFHYYPDLQLDSGRVAVQQISAITDVELDQLASGIVVRAVMPSYINRKNLPSLSIRQLHAFSSIAIEWCKGERYNTPSPLRKLKLERNTANNLSRWDKLAEIRWDRKTITSSHRARVMLPLQMQPEANIDCWGVAAFRNQTKLAIELARRLQGNGYLLLKANPHAKYEMSDELILAIEENPNILPVPRRLGMGVVWNDVDAFVTVTGTVAIEALLADKPLYLLSRYLCEVAPTVKWHSNLDDFSKFMDSLTRTDPAPLLSTSEKRAILRKMHDNSFIGAVGDPRANPACLAETNIDLLTDAFLFLLNNAKFVKNNTWGRPKTSEGTMAAAGVTA